MWSDPRELCVPVGDLVPDLVGVVDQEASREWLFVDHVCELHLLRVVKQSSISAFKEVH